MLKKYEYQGYLITVEGDGKKQVNIYRNGKRLVVFTTSEKALKERILSEIKKFGPSGTDNRQE